MLSVAGLVITGSEHSAAMILRVASDAIPETHGTSDDAEIFAALRNFA
jgi:hypothetical protein